MNKIFENCLLASDVDGTLMEQGYINPRNFAAINEFVELGGTFCIATGRCPAAMKHIVSQFNNMKNVIYYNGGMVCDCQDNKPLTNKTIAESDKENLRRFYTKFSDIGIEIYSGDEVYMVRESSGCRVHFNYERLPVKFADFDEVMDLPWNKIMTFYEGDFDDTEILDELYNFKPECCSLAMAAAIIDGVHYRGFEHLPKSTDKGQGLLELANILGIPNENTFAIGDYYNDFEMLKSAGVSACPIESPDDIKETVDFVAGGCRQGAVADFIEYLKNKAI